jgi:hypothetical protein
MLPATGAQIRLSPQGQRAVRWVLVLAGVLGALLALETTVLHITTDPINDAQAYYWAGGRLNAGLPLYPPDQSVETPLGYPYPPLLAILWRPLALLPWPVAAGIWEAVILASFAATVWRLGVRRRTTWLAIGMLGLPIAWCLIIGQAQVLLTMFMVFATPWSVALAANIKLFPALTAMWWVGRRDWRGLRQFVVAMVVLLVIQLVLAPQACIDYVTAITLKQVGEVRNISPYAFSPILWAALAAVGAAAVLALARTRFGWAAAVAFTVLANPRLLVYQLMTFLATVVDPRHAQDHRDDAARSEATA